MEAVCRVAAPLAGGLLIELVGAEAPPAAGAVLCIGGALAFFEAAPAELQTRMLKGEAAAKPKRE